MTTSGAWRPPPRSNRRVRMSLPTRPPPTITNAPVGGPVTTGAARKSSRPGRPGRDRAHHITRATHVFLTPPPSTFQRTWPTRPDLPDPPHLPDPPGPPDPSAYCGDVVFAGAAARVPVM